MPTLGKLDAVPMGLPNSPASTLPSPSRLSPRLQACGGGGRQTQQLATEGHSSPGSCGGCQGHGDACSQSPGCQQGPVPLSWGGKGATWGPDSKFSIPLPAKACDTGSLKSPLSLKIMSWDKTIKLRVKTHPFTANLQGPFGLTLTSFSSLIYNHTLHRFFTPDTLALLHAFVLAVLLATTGPLHMLFGLHLECSCLCLSLISSYLSLTSQLSDHFLKNAFPGEI